MNFKKRALTLVALTALSVSAMANTPTNEEIYQMMKEMKEELAKLKAENELLRGDVKEVAAENKSLRGEVEDVAVATDEAIKAQVKLSNKTTIGGYGELHYNNLRDQKGQSNKHEMDFHRFVLFVNYEYNDKLRLVSELELEHSVSGDGQVGEIELEQAYVQYDVTDRTSVVGGLFLMPVGILNETHEPSTFYGVERNNVEKYIVPTSWWEGGAMVQHEIMDGLGIDLTVTSGLKATSDTDFDVRDGRQKVGSADAHKLAYTGRLKYTAIPGLELAGTVNYQDNFGQDAYEGVGSATLYEAHAVYNRDQFGLRALYATWDIEGSAVKALGQDKQYGYYVEPSYRFSVYGEDLGVFTRYSLWDNKDGSGSTLDTKYKQYDVGLNWWVDKDVVLKVDYQIQDVGAGIDTELDGLNLGLGYQF
ncbi:MAG: porin [Nitrosomonadales bacterium]|nr:porin [Nitrosomonadales bacterium]